MHGRLSAQEFVLCPMVASVVFCSYHGLYPTVTILRTVCLIFCPSRPSHRWEIQLALSGGAILSLLKFKWRTSVIFHLKIEHEAVIMTDWASCFVSGMAHGSAFLFVLHIPKQEGEDRGWGDVSAQLRRVDYFIITKIKFLFNLELSNTSY